MSVDVMRLCEDTLVNRVVVIEGDEAESSRLPSRLVLDYLDLSNSSEVVKVVLKMVFSVIITNSRNIES